MTAAGRAGKALRRMAAVFAVLLAAAIVGAPAPQAFAQEQGGGWSLRDLLFPRRRERVQPPPAPVETVRPKRNASRPVARKAPPPEPVVEKAPDARTVLVVGDFMAGGLAEGLDALFAQNAGVRIADRSKGSSGLVRDDVYDWPAGIGEIIAAEKPAAVLVMIGSNDRQPMKVGDTREPPRSDAWSKQYEQRAEALGKRVEAGKVPFLWVGLPSFKPAKMTSDMLAFNDVYRAAAEKAGGEFVDIWDGFVDENGAFIATGPDVNGQPVRLRGDDGINMTRAGKAKLAFYAEKPLLKILGLGDPSGAGSFSAPAGPPAVAPAPAAAPATVDRTPPMMLDDPALDGGAELLGAATPGHSGATPAADEAASEAAPGRADDFSWPPQPRPTADATAATAP